MPTVTLPDWWALVMPCGCVDGMRRAVIDGAIVTASAQDAWEKFTRLKRDRDREVREGWVCRAGTEADWESFKAGCVHVPGSDGSGS